MMYYNEEESSARSIDQEEEFYDLNPDSQEESQLFSEMDTVDFFKRRASKALRQETIPKDSQAEVARRAKQGDQKAANMLFNQFIWLIISLANKYKRVRGVEFMDLIQVGYMGAQEAILSHDPQKSSLSNWVYRCAKNEIIGHIHSHSRTIKLEKGVSKAEYDFKMASRTLSATLGKEYPDTNEMAQYLGISEEDVRNMSFLFVETVYIDDLVFDKDGSGNVDSDFSTIQEDKIGLDPASATLMQEELNRCCKEIRQLLKRVEETERVSPQLKKIFRVRYGLENGLEEVTGEEISRMRGCTRQYTDQCVKKVWRFLQPLSTCWTEDWLQEKLICAENLSKFLNYDIDRLIARLL